MNYLKKSRRIKENGETKEMLVSQIMDINDETIICTMPSRQGKMIVLEVGTMIEAFFIQVITFINLTVL